MSWSSSFDVNGPKDKVNKNQRPLDQSADTQGFAEAVRQNQKPQAEKMLKKPCQEFDVREEKKPFASHSRFSDLCDEGHDCVTTHSKSTMCTNGKSYAECCRNSKAEKRAWSSSRDFVNKQRVEHTGTPVFLRSSSLDNSASPIDSLSEFEIPSQYRTSSLDSLSDRNYSSQVDWQVPSACSGNSVNGSPLHNCASFTQQHFVSNPSEHKCNLESSYENISCGNFKEEKPSSCSPGDNGSSSSLLSDGFDEDLDARFMEELHKHRENSAEGWTSYYELLNIKIVEKSLKEKESPLNGEHHFSYVHQTGKDFSGLDDFNDEIYTSYDTVVNKSNTSGRLPSDEKPAASYRVKSEVFAGGSMEGSSGSVRASEKGKETSSTKASSEESPSLSSSEKDFYRNLKYYFGGGKVKSRKLSPGVSDSFNESQNKVKSEQKTSCKQDSGYAESFSSDSGPSPYNKQFCTDNKQSSFPKRSEKHAPKDGPKVSQNCGVQSEWTSSTERAKGKTSRKTSHLESSEGSSFRAEQRETRFATDSHLPKSTDKGKNKQCTEREPTCSTFETQESEFRGWKPKDSVRNGSSASRKKHNAPGTRLKRRRSREKIETIPPSNDAAAECKSVEQEQTDATFDLGWLGPSFTQLKKTGKNVAASCGQYCGVAAFWMLAIATLIVSTAIAGAIHMCSVMYSRCQQYLRVSAIWIGVKGKVSTWYQWLKSWIKLPKRSVDRNQSFNLPKSGSDAIQQMLSNKDSDPYSVLGVAEDAADEDIKRQYRKLAILVHPDKNPHPDADEAFKILKNAFETLETPEKRMSYENEMRRQKADESWAASDEGPDRYFNEYRQKMRDIKNHIYCESCDGRHRRYPTNRPVDAARYCAQCHIRHVAKEGDVWLESSLMGFKVHFYACMDNEVFEVSDWAKCQKLNSMDRIPADAHSVSLKIRTHPTRPTHSNHRNFPFRSEEDLLGDLLRDMFRHDYSDFPFGDYPHHNRPKKRAGKRKKRR